MPWNVGDSDSSISSKTLSHGEQNTGFSIGAIHIKFSSIN